MSPLLESLRPRRGRRGPASVTFAYFRAHRDVMPSDCLSGDAAPSPGRHYPDIAPSPDGHDRVLLDGLVLAGLAACWALSRAFFIFVMSCPYSVKFGGLAC